MKEIVLGRLVYHYKVMKLAILARMWPSTPIAIL